MFLFVLLAIKLVLFYFVTHMNYSPLLVFSMDMFCLGVIFFAFNGNRGFRKTIITVLYVLLSLIMFADAAYYTYFTRLPVISELGHAGNLGDVTDALKMVLGIKNLLFILDIPIVIYLSIKNKIPWRKAFKNNVFALVIIILSGAFVAINFSNFKSARKLSLFGYHIGDIAGINDVSEVNVNDVNLEDMLGGKDFKSKTNELSGLGKGKNLIIIQVESLNNFVIGRKYNGEEITPNLNKLIEENGSIYCSDYFEMLGAGNTSDAEFVSLHSLYPSMKNPSYEVYLDKYLYGLPKILKDHGYGVTAYHGYKRDFWIRDRAYPHIGIDEFYAEDNYKLDEIIGMGLSDESFFDQSLEIMRNKKEPFFSFMITLTSHVPYEMPEDKKVIKILPEDEGSIFGNYMNAVRYTDHAIGKFIEGLKRNGIYDNSVIAIYGDHHGMLMKDEKDNKRIEKLIEKPYDFDTMLNIPCILHIGGYDKKLVIDKVRSQIDLTPTILNILGIDSSKYVMFGKDIMDPEHPATLYPQSYMIKGSFIDDDYIFKMGRDGIFENGILKKRGETTPIDNSIAREKYLQGLKEIELSKSILENDRLKELEEGVTSLEEASKNTKKKLSDAVRVSNKSELKEAFDKGYETFYINLDRDPKGYFTSGNIFEENSISLGDLVGIYDDKLNFIIESKDEKELVDKIRSLPGLYKNLILKIDDTEAYEYSGTRQNGYSLLLDASDIANDTIKAMAESDGDLIFLNIKDTEGLDESLIEASYNSFENGLKIVGLDEAEQLGEHKDVKLLKDKGEPLEITSADSKIDKKYLLDYKDDKILTLDFMLDEKEGARLNPPIKNDIKILEEVFEKNKNFKMAVRADANNVEILRSLLSYSLDRDRICPILNSEQQIVFASKMGHKSYVFESKELTERENQEITNLWGAKEFIIIRSDYE